MRVIGIDPGLDGAFACWDTSAKSLFVENMPTLTRQLAGGKTKRILDLEAVYALLERMRAPTETCVAYIEQVGGLPGQSAPAAFEFGYGVGLVRMALHVHGFMTTSVASVVWKGAMRAPKDKKAAVARAIDLFPAHAYAFRNGSESAKSGRAEAAMIALYGARQETGALL